MTIDEQKDVNDQLNSSINDIQDLLGFEEMLSDISAHFVNLSAEQVDTGIEDAQRLVCEYLRLSLCALWQLTEDDPNILILSHLYRPLGGPPVPDRMKASEYFPWSFQKVRANKVVIISSMENAPEEAARDVESWRHYGIKTIVTFPLFIGDGTPFGAVSFSDMRSERQWSENLVKRLQLVARVFANALARKHADEALRESEKRLSIATDAAGVGLWVMELDNEKVWVSDKLRELFGFAPDEEVSYQSFFKKIHPNDHDQVHKAVRQALESGENFHSDYRILLPEGRIRWISARGNRHLGKNGRVDRLMGVSLDITERMTMEKKLADRLQEIEDLKNQLEAENLFLQKEIQYTGGQNEIIGQSLAVKRILAEAQEVAKTDSTVLILGETGTGKEMLARAIHKMSNRSKRIMVTINCASIPPTLIESELFGRERGAYTGALTKMIGRFEVADGSTLFLDEIGEMPIERQGKLLRFLEEGVFERLGSTKPIHVNVRIIAATNRDIENEVEKGKFRKDLFYRLNVFPIMSPPLRERREDIPLLIWSFVKEFKKRMGKDVATIPKKTMEALQSYTWPGNVRELRNVIEHAMILSNSPTLVVDLPKFKSKQKTGTQNLGDMERQHIISVLEKTDWRVGGKGGAAEILNLKRSTLYSKMKKLNIVRPHP